MDFTPYVAIVGGFWRLDKEDGQKATAAREVGRRLGEALAEHGFGLVVYFADDHSLEPHVVQGYVAKAGDRSKMIHVRYPTKQRGKIKFLEEEGRPDLFDHQVVPGDDWEAPFYRSLSEDKLEGTGGTGVDGIILAAGGTSTLIAGHIAIARNLPILAVDEFDGAAAKIWAELSHRAENGRIQTWQMDKLDELVKSFKNDCAARALKRDKEDQIRINYEKSLSRRACALQAGGAFLVLLVPLLFGITAKLDASTFLLAMICALIAAGATGALLRAAIWPDDGGQPTRSSVLGAVAGFVVGLAYLAPQFVGEMQLLTEAGMVKAPDKIQLISVTLVALSAGVGFDAVFRRLRKGADNLAVAP